MGRKILIGSGLGVLLAAAYLLDTIVDAGVFRDINPHYNGTCTRVLGAVGVEDITVDHDSGLAYLSSHDRRTWAETGKKEGDIYVYRPGSLAAPLAMSHDLMHPFNPHGISLWKSQDGPDRLFVVNHPDQADGPIEPGNTSSQVEVFEIIAGALRHLRTVKTDAPYSLNDVAAVGKDEFFATIDKGSFSAFGRTMETFLRLPRGGIAFADKLGMRKVMGGLTYPNGIQVVGDLVWVAESTGRHLIAFERKNSAGAITEIERHDLASSLDNIELAADGTLWIGAHPQALKFPGHAADAAVRSPSQVLKVAPGGDGANVLEIYLNDGDPLSGSSVAAPYKRRLLVGSVFEPFILDCSL